MAKIYNQQLTSEDDITVKTYYKNKNCFKGCSLDVFVTDITDLLVGGTVKATIGDTDSSRIYNKSELFAYINFSFHSD
jgi:hypothetical protein